MPIRLRKRGDIWHARGTVRVGRKTIVVAGFSTGCRSRADAEAVVAAEEARIRGEELDGPAGRARRLTVAACILAYLDRPGGVPEYDQDRLADFNERIGARKLDDLAAAWGEWLRTRGKAMAPGTAARWRAILQAAITHGAEANGIATPRLPAVRVPTDEATVYLTRKEQERLLGHYSPNAAPVALVLALQGLRTSEALRLDWRDVSLSRRTLFIRKTKSGRPRTVPMHPRVLAMLAELHRERRKPEAGPVFLSARGEAYRATEGRGGNPLAKAHATACRRAKIAGFRVHDWRHHWASWQVMSGTDLLTLAKLGGWATLRMVQRYAAVSDEHLRKAAGRGA